MPIIQTTKKLPKRRKFDYYPTPAQHCAMGLAMLPADLEPRRIFDPGAGAGAWGTAARSAWPGAYIAGAEYRIVDRCPAYDRLYFGVDFLNWAPPRLEPAFDLIIGNPPYNLAESFVRRSYAMLGPGGYMILLLPLSFLASRTRRRGLWAELPLLAMGACAERPSFTNNGRTNATDYGLFLWRQGHAGRTELRIV